MENQEESLFLHKNLKPELSFNELDLLNKISLLESLSDNKMNEQMTYYKLLSAVKQINAFYLEKDFFIIEETFEQISTLIKIIKIHIKNIKRIIDEILNLFYGLTPETISKNDYKKIRTTVTKCVFEIDNIINKAYHNEKHLMFLTGVDKETTLKFKLIDPRNKELAKIINKCIPDGIDFIFCLPAIDTISLGIFGYTLDQEYRYENMEFISYEKITNMEKCVKNHIQNFNTAYEKILFEEKMMENFAEIFQLKKELFYLNKEYIISEYLKKNTIKNYDTL